MSIIPGFPKILHGGDYNPDQWLETPEIINDDFRLMDQAHCNTFSVGIFSWGQIEVKEGCFEFGWLDDIFERCASSGKKLFLATPSAARPGWMVQKYPETSIGDPHGVRNLWTSRQSACLSSPVFREKVRIINRKLAERYACHPALGGWHISNEYSTNCRCPVCRAKFTEWLKERYGTLENLNRHYWSAFWSHTITDWDQINTEDGCLNIISLDWKRFVSNLHVEFMKMETSVIREYSKAPLTTNMMGLYGFLDYWKIAKECDFISDDCYPTWYPGIERPVAANFAALHDMHYSMQKKPFLIMESCPGTVNYKPYMRPRRPGELEREHVMAMGHGADGTMYFQWRKGRGNCEQHHGAVVGHDGSNQTMIFQSVAEYGRKIERITEIIGSQRKPQAALILDWEARWNLDFAGGYSGKNGKKTDETIFLHYQAMFEQNIDMAVIDEDQDLSDYKLLLIPMAYLIKDAFLKKLKVFVQNGGIAVMTYLSGYTDASNQCWFGGNPCGPEGRSLFGIWNEDIDGLVPSAKQTLNWNGINYEVEDFAEILHAEGAEVLGTYGSEFYAGSPALTMNRYGSGKAYYIGCRTKLDFLKDFYGLLCKEAGIKPVMQTPDGVHASVRFGNDGTRYCFIENFSGQPATVNLPEAMEDLWIDYGTIKTELKLESAGSAILKVK